MSQPAAPSSRGARRRRILCVFPRYARSFGTMHHAWPLVGGVRAFMPPQGLLVAAACLPADWEVRLVDENVRPARGRDYRWADAVLMSGMHVQRGQIEAIYRRFERQCEHVCPNRKAIPPTPARANARNLLRALSVLGRICRRVGVLSDYRRRFWKTAVPFLRRGRVEEVVHTAVIAHHMIEFARECAGGGAEKSFYRPTGSRSEPGVEPGSRAG